MDGEVAYGLFCRLGMYLVGARHGCDLPMCIHTSSSLRWRGEVLYPTRLVGWRAAAFVGAGWRMFELYNVSLIFCSLADPGASDI